jgi:TPR repeat protein
MPRSIHPSSIVCAIAVIAVSLAAPVQAGRDIVRIVTPDVGVSVVTPPVTPPPARPPVTPPPNKTPPPPAKTTEKAGKFVKLPVRLGTLASDSTRPWLGVNLDNDPLDRAVAITVGLMTPSGALITETTPGGPAASAGLRAGDIAVSVDGTAVANSDQLRQALGRSPPGTTVNIEAWRFVPETSDFVSQLRSLGDGGNAAVMAMLGNMFTAGKGVPRNDGESATWYRKAAEAGHAVSMAEYAMMLAEGRGVPRNDAEALRWYRAGAETAANYPMWRYGLMLIEGKLTAKDPAQAAQYMQRAADAGFAAAMYDLAVMNHNGIGMARNYQNAARWYQKAVDLNNTGAMVNLGLLYDEGKGVEQSDQKAVELYRRAAGMNHPSGMQNLGVMLDNGRGVPQRDPEQAAEMILKAVSLHNEFSYKQLTSNHAAYTREFRFAVQRRLQSAGLYTGPIDGDFGQSTQAAVTAFYNRR